MLEFGIGLFIGFIFGAATLALLSAGTYDKGYRDALRKVLRDDARLENESPRG